MNHDTKEALKEISDATNYPHSRGPEGPKALVSCRALVLVTERLLLLEGQKK